MPYNDERSRSAESHDICRETKAMPDTKSAVDVTGINPRMVRMVVRYADERTALAARSFRNRGIEDFIPPRG